MKKRTRVTFNLISVAALLAAGLLSVSCSKDDTQAGSAGGNVRFSMAKGQSWSAATRTEGEETATATEVLTLRGETEADTLFIHSSVSETMGSPEAGQTRAAPVDDMSTYGAFGVFGYSYTGSWTESLTPNLMYNVQIQQQGSVWAPSSVYYWPGAGKKVKFFAYAPYNGTGLTLPSSTAIGTPVLSYTVPAAVADQKDLLVAQSAELPGDQSTAAPLTFNHALTAIKFVVGSDMLPGKITSISLKGVYGNGTYKIGDPTWSGFGAVKTFSQSLNFDTDGTAGEAITAPAATFMMIPQMLPPSAEIEVQYKDNLTGITRTLTASIAGSDWYTGQTVTYKLSTTSISIQYVLTVTPPIDYTYLGGEKRYTVQSHKVVSRPGDVSRTISVYWNVDFSMDNGQTWVGLGSTNFVQTATTGALGNTSNAILEIKPQTSVIESPENDALKAAAPVYSYDLSTKGGTVPQSTSNCYIVNGPGTYSIPLVYGNAVKDGAPNPAAYTPTGSPTPFVDHADQPISSPYMDVVKPNNATLIWQDTESLVSNIYIDIAKKNINFAVNQNAIQQGNAIIAVRNQSNEILWSWHIWVTDYKLGDNLNDVFSVGNNYRFMPLNIGWCAPDKLVYAGRSCLVRLTQQESGKQEIFTARQTEYIVERIGNNPYFQWGRKDPMLPGVLGGVNNNQMQDKACYTTTSVYAFTSANAEVSVGQAIQTPYTFHGAGFSSWTNLGSDSYGLWNGEYVDNNDSGTTTSVKTIYDPSPAGYKTPPSFAWKVFTTTGLSASGSGVNAGEWGENGVTLYGSPGGTGSLSYFPYSGLRSGASVSWLGQRSYCWQAKVTPINYAHLLNIVKSSTNVIPNDILMMRYAFSVRPVQE